MQPICRALATALLGFAFVLPAHAQYKAPAVSRDARNLQQWVLQSHDHGARPFAIVDKKTAHFYVYDGAGTLQGDSAVLLGEAPGDDIAPGVGEHAQQGLVPFLERTTPAGRFAAEPGVNNNGEPVIWADYDSAFAIHRLRPGRSMNDRAARLASTDVANRRASSGCVVVPVRFYEDVVQRWLGGGASVVYVLPDGGTARELSGAL